MSSYKQCRNILWDMICCSGHIYLFGLFGTKNISQDNARYSDVMPIIWANTIENIDVKTNVKHCINNVSIMLFEQINCIAL